jgi:hypothetical protein
MIVYRPDPYFAGATSALACSVISPGTRVRANHV